MRIVIKIGTSTLAYPGGRLNIRHTEELVKTFSDLKNAGHELVLVSSGAVAAGMSQLGWGHRDGRGQAADRPPPGHADQTGRRRGGAV